MKLSVHGSRTLSDERVEIILREEIQQHGVDHIVTHAEPSGVCKVARDLCKKLPLPLTLHFLDFKFLRGAFEHRSKAVLRDCGRAVFVHDGSSKGTSNELALAKKIGKPHSYHQLDIPDHEASVGFPIESEWQVDDDELSAGTLPVEIPGGM